MHSSVSVAIRDVEVPVSRDREIRRTVEGRRAADDRREVRPVVSAFGRLPRVLTKGEQKLSVGGELAHGMSCVVGAPDRIVGSDRDAVRPHGEHAFAPRADEASIALVHEHRMLGAAEEIDASFGVDRDSGDIGVRETRWKLLPAGDSFVIRAYERAHRSTSRMLMDGSCASGGGQFCRSIA